MRASVLVALALTGVGGGDSPDGRLVLGVAGYDDRLGAVTREWAAVADPRTGAIRKRRLVGGTLCHGPVVVVGDRVVFSGRRGRHAAARSLPLSLSGPARVVGRADVFTASPGEPSLWLGLWRRRAGGSVLSLEEVRPSGKRLVRARALLPREGMLHAALQRALVVTSGRWLIVWDLFRDLPVRVARDGWFVASAKWRFAWCRGDCHTLAVWRLRGQRTLALPQGARWLGTGGTFSPDGRKLALPISLHGRPRLAVANLRTRRWTVAPGELGGYDTAAWSPSGRWLYFTAGERGLRAWQVGSAITVTLPIEAGGTVMSIATVR
jgi:hypothetical protein